MNNSRKLYLEAVTKCPSPESDHGGFSLAAPASASLFLSRASRRLLLRTQIQK